jgi:CRISPR-associated endonuclease/helicase Cas3
LVVLNPAARDLTRFLSRLRDRHGLGARQDGRGTYADLTQLEATLRQLEARPSVTIPRDNRLLVERSLHPDVLETVAADLGTAWSNHAADRAGFAHAERGAALHVSLDLSTEFRALTFLDKEEVVSTRLGARDLLVDLTDAPPGPFGVTVERMAIPHWMARGVTIDDVPEVKPKAGGIDISLGQRRYRYDRWGLALST